MNSEETKRLISFVDSMYNHFEANAYRDLDTFPDHTQLVEKIKEGLSHGWAWSPCLNPTDTDSSYGDESK